MMVQFLERQTAPRLAYNRVSATEPSLPTIIFLGGFRSDMTGTKATFLYDFAKTRGQGFIRFDYQGHGQSAGRFQDSTLEDWRDDVLAIIDRLTEGPIILVGSSMGGWLGLLVALARPDRVQAFIGIAAAPDFTKTIPDNFDDIMRASYASREYVEVSNSYSDQPYIMTRDLIESGNRICLLNDQHVLPIPVILLHGKLDQEVDWHMPERIRDCLIESDLKIHIIPDGDHGLFRAQDLEILAASIDELSHR